MRRDEHPVDIHPDKETAESQDLNMMPGRDEDIENASARANREGDRDVTSLRPRDARGAGDAAHASGAGLPEGADDQGTFVTPADHPLREGL